VEKETFLTIIQGQARWPGEAQRVWEQAIKIDETDTRWSLIYDESESPAEVIRQYCKYFEGIEVAKRPRRPRKTEVEIWSKRLETAKARTAQIPSDLMAEHEEGIREIEKKLAHAMKNNL